MIRVGIADDHNLVRQGVRSLLEKANDVAVIGEATDGHQAVELCERTLLPPDVLLLDVGMSRMNGIQAAQAIRARHLGTRIVMLSMHDNIHLVRQSLRAGANAYVLKSALFDELLCAIQAVIEGQVYVSHELAEALEKSALTGLLMAVDDEPDTYMRLSSREREILKLLVEGHTNVEMADVLNISVRTVEKHRGNLMDKLEVHDVGGLTRIA